MKLLSCCVLFALSAMPAGAEVERDTAGVTVEKVHLTPLPGEDAARLRFQIDNFGTRDIVVTGVGSPSARSGALFSRGRGLGPVETAAVFVPRGESIDFGTAHLRAVLQGFGRPLENGESVPVTLDFARETLATEAHVHGGSE